MQTSAFIVFIRTKCGQCVAKNFSQNSSQGADKHTTKTLCKLSTLKQDTSSTAGYIKGISKIVL